jgi:hypothetical protein
VRNQTRSLRGTRTNHVLEPPPIARSILKRERDGKFEKAINLKKPSLAMITHLKIDAV